MRYLFFANTPAHVHMYRHAVDELEDQGHDVLVLARDYGCTIDLAEWYDLPYSVYGYCDTSKGSLFYRLPGQYFRCIRDAWQFDPDLIFGVGAYAAHTGAILRAPTILITDSEPTGLDQAVSTPFAQSILTPDTFRKGLDGSHYVFSGFKECAYLHPDVYSSDPTVRSELGVEPDEKYVIVRLNAFGSHHDVGKEGFTKSQRRQLVEALDERATVFVSDESGTLEYDDIPAEPFDLHPARLHDALAGASLLVADTQTMTTEAALLGTPAIRSNSFVGESDMGNFVELEKEDLIYNVAEFDEVLDRAKMLLDADGVGETWRRRRTEYMADKVNLTEVIVDVAERLGDVSGVDELHRFGKPDRIEQPPTPQLDEA